MDNCIMPPPREQEGFDTDREIRALRWRAFRKTGTLLLLSIAFCIALVAVTDLMVKLARSGGQVESLAEPSSDSSDSVDKKASDERKNPERKSASEDSRSPSSLPPPPRLREPPRLD